MSSQVAHHPIAIRADRGYTAVIGSAVVHRDSSDTKKLNER